MIALAFLRNAASGNSRSVAELTVEPQEVLFGVPRRRDRSD
jgi:hypothetical protein